MKKCNLVCDTCKFHVTGSRKETKAGDVCPWCRRGKLILPPADEASK